MPHAADPTTTHLSHDGFMTRMRAEVCPIEPDRWIAVIDALAGAFSTETKHPGDLRADAEKSAAAVLRRNDVTFDAVDDLGWPWAEDMANE